MQSVSSRIWTRIAVSISYNDNHYTMGTLVNDCEIDSNWVLHTFLVLNQACATFYEKQAAWNLAYPSDCTIKKENLGNQPCNDQSPLIPASPKPFW